MGAWGPGLRENDTALDAIDRFKRQIGEVLKGRRDPMGLFNHVVSEFGEEATDALLGVADALVDGQADLGPSSGLLLLVVGDAARDAALAAWSDPAGRVGSLQAFVRRFLRRPPRGKGRAGRSWRSLARDLRREVILQLAPHRKAARSFADRTVGDACRRQPTLKEKMGILMEGIELLEAGFLSEGEMTRLVGKVERAGWRLPERHVAKLAESFDPPRRAILAAIARLRSSP